VKDNGFFFRFKLMLLMIASGMINAYCVFNFKIPVTHHTGNATAIALSIYDLDRFLVLISIFTLFFLGSLCGSYLTYGDKFKRGFVILAILTFLSNFLKDKSVYLLTFIFGFQNSLLIKYDDTLIRSSHITGYLTDSAAIIGRFFRDRDNSKLHISLFFLTSIFFFILGGVLFLFADDFSQIVVSIIYVFLAITF
jgi:uncharacterized membrane protein YoaK (UPF0700 family)